MNTAVTHTHNNRHKASIGLCLFTLLASWLVVACSVSMQAQQRHEFKPQIPSASRYQRNKVFLERADSMVSGPANTYIILKGNIEFTRGDMHLYCDSAHFYDMANTIDAYGNVRMERADNLSGRADNLHYNGNKEVVNLLGNVSLTKDNRTLTSEAIDYFVPSNTGKYKTGGKLEDPKNILTSIVGTYNFDSEEAVFSNQVELLNNRDNYVMHTNRLNYNTRSNVATLVEPTTITSNDNKIITHAGNYNTVSEEAVLLKKNGIQPKLFAKDGRTLEGDKIHYDRHKNEGYAQGNVVVNDPKHKAILTGGYGYHNEKTHVSFATNRALAKLYNKADAKAGERSDTLFFHADTLKTYVEGHDSLRVLTANNGVRFYRKDLQGLCGHLVFAERDSILNLYNHPVVWSGNRQISSDNEINVHMRDSSSVDWAKIPNKALLIEHLGEIYYNQLSGKSLTAYFEKVTDYHDDGTQESRTELRHADVVGNVKTLFFPQENDSTYNKCIKTESGFLSLDMKAKQEVEKIKMWPEVSGSVIPLFVAKPSQLRLDEYEWFDDLRPKSPYEVLDITDAMRAMISQPYVVSSNQESKKNATSLVMEKEKGEKEDKK